MVKTRIKHGSGGEGKGLKYMVLEKQNSNSGVKRIMGGSWIRGSFSRGKHERNKRNKI